MTENSDKRDVLVLVADRNIKAAVAGILSRPQSLQIRKVAFDVRSHPHRDSGCCLEGVEFVRAFRDRYRHALLIFDLEGSGREGECAEDIEQDLENKLAATGWEDHASVIVLVPELETWVWSDSPHVARELGWKAGMRDLRAWLEARGLWQHVASKPERPKKTLEAILRHVKKPRSSAVYGRLAEKVSFNRCTDRSFLKLTSQLQHWFAEA